MAKKKKAKARARTAPARKARKKASRGPKAVTTGKGPNAADIGRLFVELFNGHAPDAHIWDRLFHPAFESIEGHGVNLCYSGRKAAEQKAREFLERNIVHGASAEGPFVGSTGFSVKFRVDLEEKPSGKRQVMEDIAVYTVRNGKVVREEFMYRF